MAAGRVVWSGAGRAYHDQNVSDVPVMQLQIQEWSWGRLAAPQAEVVHYVCHGVSPAATTAGAGTTSAPRWERLLQIDESGRVEIEEDPGFVEAGWGGGRWGLAAPATLGCTRGRLLGVPGASVQIGPVLDESPFYLRYPLTVPALGGVGAPLRGYGERFRPGSLQPWWAQAMVKMCVTQDRAPSGLLPWFSGPHDDRAQRLWSWWWS